MKKKVLIIGGGASGLMAAIMAAREGAEVTILEHMDRVGKKFYPRETAVQHDKPVPVPGTLPEQPEAVSHEGAGPFLCLGYAELFDGIGIVTKNRNGYIYPNSDQAASVLDALRFETEHLGIQTVLSCHIRRHGRRKMARYRGKRPGYVSGVTA